MSEPIEESVQQELGNLRVLPPEIRLQIWRYSLPDSANLDLALANTPENPAFKHRYIFVPPLEPPVYRLSKQIRKEALSILEPTLTFNSMKLELRHTCSAIQKMSANVKPRIRSVRVDYNRSTKFEAWQLFRACNQYLRMRGHAHPLQGVIFRCSKHSLAARILSEEEVKSLLGQMSGKDPRSRCGNLIIELPAVEVRYWHAMAQLRRQFIQRIESEAQRFQEQNIMKFYVSSQWAFEGDDECRAILKVSLYPQNMLTWCPKPPQGAEPMLFNIATRTEEMQFERTFRTQFIDTPGPEVLDMFG